MSGEKIEAFQVRSGGSQLSGEGDLLLRLIGADEEAREVVLALSIEQAKLMVASVMLTLRGWKGPPVQ